MTDAGTSSSASSASSPASTASTASPEPPSATAGPAAPLPPPVPPVPFPQLPQGATGPSLALPREPGPVGRSLTAFWAERTPASASVVGVSLALGLVCGVLLVGHPLGLGAALVGLLVWVLAVPVLVRRRAAGDLLGVVLAAALVAVAAVRDAGWLVALCLVGAAVVGAVAATSARSGPAVLLSGATWLAGAARAVRWLVRGTSSALGERRTSVLATARSVAVTVVLVGVFGALFASADPVFASLFPRFEAADLPGQLVVGLVMALVLATTAHLALAPPGWSGAALPPGRPVPRGEWMLPVGALVAMVWAFVLVQVGALLGGHRHVLEVAGLTYAQYAREGFAQLVAATALTLGVVAVAARRAPRASAGDRLAARLALGLLCVGTLGVVASALRRMDLYVEAFGLTRLRLVVVAGEVAMGVVLLLVLVAGVRWRGAWLPRAVVHVAAIALLGLAAVNPDALIVRHNTTASLAVAPDLSYLAALDDDAVPAMAALDEPLRSCLLEGRAVPADVGLAGWNLGRQRAADALAGLEVDADPGVCARAGVPTPLS